MEIITGYETLKVSDGTTMRAWFARPKDGAAHAGLLVFQEAFGVNAHIRDIAERFAKEGYLAIAPELFHRTGPGFEGRYDDFPSTMPHMRALTDAGTEVDQRAAYEWLRTNGRESYRSRRSVTAWEDAPRFSRRLLYRWRARFRITAEELHPVRIAPD